MLTFDENGREITDSEPMNTGLLMFDENGRQIRESGSMDAGSRDSMAVAMKGMQRLTSGDGLGLSPESAAGMMGNLWHETGGFKQLDEINPRQGNGGLGWAQWTGQRRRNFENFASARQMDPYADDANLDFLTHELVNTPESRVMPSLRQARSAGEASDIFAREFERPGVPALERRRQYADRILAAWHAGGAETDAGQGGLTFTESDLIRAPMSDMEGPVTEQITPKPAPKPLMERMRAGLSDAGDAIQDVGYNLAMTPAKNNPLNPDNVLSAAKSGIYGLGEGSAGLIQAGMEGAHRYLTGPLAHDPAKDPFLNSAQYYGGLRQRLNKAGDDLMPKTDNPTLAGIYSGIRSFSQNALPMLAGVATGRADLALSGMTGAVFGQEFGKARDLGKGFEYATLHGGAQSGIEYLTEKLPAETLLKSLKTNDSLWKTIGKQIATELPGEELATVLQTIEEKIALKPDTTWAKLADELPGQMYQTAIATMVASGAQAGLGYTVQKTADRIAEGATLQSLMGNAEFRDIMNSEVDSSLKGIEKGRAARKIWAERQAVKALAENAPKDTPLPSTDAGEGATGAPAITSADLYSAANKRINELDNYLNGTPDKEIIVPDTGKKQVVRGSGPGFASPKMQDELAFLKANINNPEALAKAYGFMLQAESAPDAALSGSGSPIDAGEGAAANDQAPASVISSPGISGGSDANIPSGGVQVASEGVSALGQNASTPAGQSEAVDAPQGPAVNRLPPTSAPLQLRQAGDLFQITDGSTVISEHANYMDALDAMDQLQADVLSTAQQEQSHDAQTQQEGQNQARQEGLLSSGATPLPAGGQAIPGTTNTVSEVTPQVGQPSPQSDGNALQAAGITSLNILPVGTPHANDPTTGTGDIAPGATAGSAIAQGAEPGTGMGPVDGRDRPAGESAGGNDGPSAAASTADNPVGEPALVLQNRNRSTPASVQQMQSIAGNPDYLRLSPSRNFAEGAPVIAGGQIPAVQMGRKETTVTTKGRRIPVQYAVVESDSILASNNADGTVNAQYGDTAIQAPRAIAGNGRIAGLQKAYRQGSAGQYRADLAADDLHGISPDVINGMKAPVLVRVMPESELTQDIGDESNISGGLALSAVEQARNDMTRMDLDGVAFDDNGELSRQSVVQFVRSMPESEQGALLDTDGTPNRQAFDRLSAAVFQKAYENDELVRLHAQAADPDSRLVMSTLAKLAPKFARLKDLGLFDVRGWLTDAAKVIVSGRRRGLSLAELAEQQDLDIDPHAYEIVRMFADTPRSAKSAIEYLSDFADFAYNEATRDTEDLFGTGVPRATPSDLRSRLESYRERRRQEALEQRGGTQSVSQRATSTTSDSAGSGNPESIAGTQPAATQAEGGDLFPAASAADRVEADRIALEERQKEQARNRNATQAPPAEDGLFALDNQQDQLKFSLRPDEQQQQIRQLNRGIDAHNRRYAGGNKSDARSRVELAAPEDVPVARRIEWRLASAIAAVFKHIHIPLATNPFSST